MAARGSMRKAWLAAALVLCAALIGTTVLAPGALHRVEMASETDGVHQDDHKLLGFLPYSTQRADPSLRVTEDAFAALESAGVRDLPETHQRLPSYPVIRMLYPGKAEYCVQFGLGKRPAKDVADFYARQLTKPVRGHGPVGETVDGVCPDGKTHLLFVAYKGSPAQLRFGPRP